MADQFVGLRIRLHIKPPLGGYAEGIVTRVVEGSINLTQVILSNGQRPRNLYVQGSTVRDLEILGQGRTPTAAPAAPVELPAARYDHVTATAPHQQPSQAVSPPRALQSWPRASNEPTPSDHQVRSNQSPAVIGLSQPQSPPQKPFANSPQPPSFVDPAIVSYNITHTSPASPVKHSEKSRPTRDKFETTNGRLINAELDHAQVPTPAAIEESSAPVTAAGTNHDDSHKLLQNLNLGDQDLAPTQPKPSIPMAAVTHEAGHQHAVGSKESKRGGARRGGRGRGGKQHQPPHDGSSPELSRDAPPAEYHEGGGWRLSPLLQDSPKKTPGKSQVVRQGTTGGQPEPKSAQKKSRKQRNQARRIQSGWGTGDATDIQGMGEFDFVGNQSKFDKKTVFEEIRNGDTTADEDLLVTHNRVMRPGTFEGKNLHPSENVLDNRQGSTLKDVSFESDSHSEEPFDMLASQEMKRAASRASVIQQTSRKNSSRFSDTSHQTAYPNPNHPNFSQVPFSPTTNRVGSSMSQYTATPHRHRRAGFRNAETGRSVPVVFYDAIQEVKHKALKTCDLDGDIVADRFGRSIAEVALSAINPGGRRLNSENHNAAPVVVFLVDRDQSCKAAMVASGYLAERGVSVIVTAVNMILHSEHDFGLPHLTEGPFKPYMRSGLDTKSWTETSELLKTLDAPPELIVDGLSCFGVFRGRWRTGGPDMWIEDEKMFEQFEQVMSWANRSKASVLAVDRPSGMDPDTGSVRIKGGEPVEIRAKIVVCAGVPCMGLLRAMESRGEEWRVYVCDVGFNRALKEITEADGDERKGKGKKKGRMIEFGGRWILPLRFDGGSGESVTG